MTKLSSLLLIIFSAFTALAQAEDPVKTENPAFASYEVIRQALLHDNLEGVEEAANKLSTYTQDLLTTSQDPKAKQSLKEASAYSTQLASATDIDSARTVFGDLSTSMIQYRNTLRGDRPIVAYCSMAKKHWLQPTEEIGNPYYGQSMASCGNVVKDKEIAKTNHHNH